MNTAGHSPREIKDRQAIQNAWVGFWAVYVKIRSFPADKRPALGFFVINTLEAQVLASANDFYVRGFETLGSVTHRPHWGPPMDDSEVAVTGGCIDTRKYGSEVLATKVKRGHGVARGKLQGIL